MSSVIWTVSPWKFVVDVGRSGMMTVVHLSPVSTVAPGKVSATRFWFVRIACDADEDFGIRANPDGTVWTSLI